MILESYGLSVRWVKRITRVCLISAIDLGAVGLNKVFLRRKQTINDTKMKYLSVENRIYEITRISFFYMSIEAAQTNLTMNDVPENETWDISEFKNYKVKLINNGGQAEIVDFAKLKEKYDLKK